MFKTLFTIATAAVLLIATAFDTHAQGVKNVLGGTNNIAASSTNDFGSAGQIFGPEKSRYLSFQTSARLVGAGTSAITPWLEYSVTGATGSWTTYASLPAITANGTNIAWSSPTNIDTGGIQYWRVRYGVNANATAATNFTVYYGYKNGH